MSGAGTNVLCTLDKMIKVKTDLMMKLNERSRSCGE